MVKSLATEYCAYRLYRGELRSDQECLIAMFIAYFDDSGTDRNSEIAVAACYISTKRGWDEFVDSWDTARHSEGFECFHMSEFLAPPGQRKEPWCDWDNRKKDHVYGRLAKIINENKRIGIAVAVPKVLWDSVPERIKQFYGREHYTFAVRKCLLEIKRWREETLLTHLPVKYIFDWEMRDSAKRKEISATFDVLTKDITEEQFGIVPGGFGFEHKEEFKPLQAADILAWQMRSHMAKLWPSESDDNDVAHPGFRVLREDQQMKLGFFTKDNIDKFVNNVYELEKRIGQQLPVLHE